jgi:hypothetical protein
MAAPATDEFEIASQSHYEGMQYCHDIVFSTWFSSVPCILLSNLCSQLGVDYFEIQHNEPAAEKTDHVSHTQTESHQTVQRYHFFFQIILVLTNILSGIH